MCITNKDDVHDQLEQLKQAHRDLDSAIGDLQHKTLPDSLEIVRMKREKLLIKDKIVRLESTLVPDIIA